MDVQLLVIYLLILYFFLTLMKLSLAFTSYLSLFLFSRLCEVLTLHTLTSAFCLGYSTVALTLTFICWWLLCLYLQHSSLFWVLNIYFHLDLIDFPLGLFHRPILLRSTSWAQCCQNKSLLDSVVSWCKLASCGRCSPQQAELRLDFSPYFSL